MAKDTAVGDASARISARIAELGGWRGETLARMRQLIHEADPEVVETWKWMGTPVFEHHGIICTGESYKQVVKLTFQKGASLPDPKGLFNSSLEGNARRAIDIREGDVVDAAAFMALFRAAVALNGAKGTAKAGAAKTAAKAPAARKGAVKKPAVKTAPAKSSTAKKTAAKKTTAKRTG